MEPNYGLEKNVENKIEFFSLERRSLLQKTTGEYIIMREKNVPQLDLSSHSCESPLSNAQLLPPLVCSTETTNVCKQS